MANIPIRQINSPVKQVAPNFRIRSVQNLLSGKDMVQELHRHDFFFVLALEKGKGHHEIDFTAYPVNDYSIFILRPGQVHQLTLRAESTGYLMEIGIGFYRREEKVTSQRLRKASDSNFCQLDSEGFAKLHSVLTYIFQESIDQKHAYLEVIKANLDIFFIELLRQRERCQISGISGEGYQQERLDEFLELMETHVAKHKQVSDYADMLNLSVYQLNAITKATLDKTPSDIITEYIILESKRYLLATSNQVNQIAHHLGYDDPSYFIRFFKKHTGHSPEAFRSNFK